MDIKLKILKKRKFKNPVLICGMPGSGYVGKLAVDHLLNIFESSAICEIQSDYFPPQIATNKGIVQTMSNKVYHIETGKTKNDILVLTGDSQPITERGNYLVSEKIIEYAKNLGIKKIFTLAAYITGEFVNEPKVYGTATEKKHIRILKNKGVKIMNQGMITGMNGILIGTAKIKGIEGYSLLGETSGYMIDPKSSKAILESLSKILKIKINLKELSNKIEETNELINQVDEMKTKTEGIEYSNRDNSSQYIN
ncbi:MAG: proteasome assembly chaperone family protein [Thaumarchaeota archaeon]|nr:proteasome assembly chaperone family protein [Nitrososphaerota archaeon]|tara:strand:+ start:31637 stop:32395 length:759 start_codon:yes stop_codon:yes gene_type:complete